METVWRYIYARLIGYARVSTNDQETTSAGSSSEGGCERIFREKASGGRWDRPELHKILDQLRKGDVLVVWKLDRLSRSLRDVLTIIALELPYAPLNAHRDTASSLASANS